MDASTKKILVYGGVALAVIGVGLFAYMYIKPKNGGSQPLLQTSKGQSAMDKGASDKSAPTRSGNRLESKEGRKTGAEQSTAVPRPLVNIIKKQ